MFKNKIKIIITYYFLFQFLTVYFYSLNIFHFRVKYHFNDLLFNLQDSYFLLYLIIFDLIFLIN